jgi:hypothetical protein
MWLPACLCLWSAGATTIVVYLDRYHVGIGADSMIANEGATGRGPAESGEKIRQYGNTLFVAAGIYNDGGGGRVSGSGYNVYEIVGGILTNGPRDFGSIVAQAEVACSNALYQCVIKRPWVRSRLGDLGIDSFLELGFAAVRNGIPEFYHKGFIGNTNSAEPFSLKVSSLHDLGNDPDPRFLRMVYCMGFCDAIRSDAQDKRFWRQQDELTGITTLIRRQIAATPRMSGFPIRIKWVDEGGVSDILTVER